MFGPMDAEWPVENSPLTYQDGRPLLRELVQARLGSATHYALFLVSGDGRLLPGTDIEESSGYVLDTTDTVHYFHFGWDAATARPGLTEWERAEPAPTWQRIAEYQQARRRLGLS